MNNLKHVGVKGMKWGVRKKRESSTDLSSTDYSQTRSLRKKSLRELSNDEIAQINRRLQLEQDFSRLNTGVAKRLGGTIVNNFVSKYAGIVVGAGAALAGKVTVDYIKKKVS